MVEQAILKCEVVRVGDRSKQVLEEKESILLGEGFAS